MSKVLSFFPIHCSDEAVSHIFYSLGREQTAGLSTTMLVPSAAKVCRQPNLIEVVTPPLRWFYYKFGNVQAIAEQYCFQKLEQFDAIHVWPGVSINLIKAAKSLNKTVFLERFNCFTGMAKQILDDAYTRLGMEPRHGIQADWAAGEYELANLADYIICPSPLVKNSFQAAGIPAHKLLLSSYGWFPQRFPNLPVQRSLKECVTILFVGSICVRKGAHLLMQAFAKSGIKGRLVFCGSMEPAIAEACKDLLRRPDIIHAHYQRDLRTIYREADIFAFPSLEEGSPLVSYEAMAHSLPLIVSPMAAGSVVRDGIEGMVIPPYDEDAWIEALRHLASTPASRNQLGSAAFERATEFTWDKVAAQRTAMMLPCIQQAGYYATQH